MKHPTTIFRSLSRLLLGWTAVVGFAPCSASDDSIHDYVISPTVSWEEFRSAHAHQIGAETLYRVEVDMLVGEEELLRRYQSSQGDDRTSTITSPLVVNLDGSSDDLRPNPTDITYCFVASWGTNQGTYTAPSLATVRQNLQSAMRAWEGVANVRFRHRNDLDGNTCNNSGTRPRGLDFVVTHYDDGGSRIATGPFPSEPWSVQRLQVPASGINVGLAVHELGHTLGLRHEHVHANGPTGGSFCDESGSSRDLTDYDALSSMAYADCTTSQNIRGSLPTRLDGIGARSVYGEPAWWWATLIF